MTAKEVKERLASRHPTSMGEWCFWEEALTHIDAFAYGTWRTSKCVGAEGIGKVRHARVSYEVKVSRADLRQELWGRVSKGRVKYGPWPDKASHALDVSHFFFLATPAGLLTKEERERREPPADGTGLWLPPECGLVEVHATQTRVPVKAPRRTPRELHPGEISSLIRLGVNPAKVRNAESIAAGLRDQVRRAERRAEFERGAAAHAHTERERLAAIVNARASVPIGSAWRTKHAGVWVVTSVNEDRSVVLRHDTTGWDLGTKVETVANLLVGYERV